MNTKEFSKKITLYLIDGTPDGRQTCELSNWTGKAIKIPRKMVKESNDRKELNGIGVYMLFGKDFENPDKDMVYIGETEDLIGRLKQHMQNKDFWNQVVIIFSKDENLNKAHLKYLEFRMYEIAKSVNRYKLENSSIPTCSNLSEADKAEMEEFLDHMKLLISTMGYKLLEELNEEKGSPEDIYHIKAAYGANATGKRTTDGFIVYKNSIMTHLQVPSIPQWTLALRNRLIENEVVKKGKNGNYIFLENYLFNSPSSAAATIMGRSANGLKEWKNNKNKQLGIVEAS